MAQIDTTSTARIILRRLLDEFDAKADERRRGMAECAHCGESIESGESYGFRVRPIGNIEQLKGVLALMGGGTDADRLIAAGWDTCIRCMAILTLDSLAPTQRNEILHRFGH